MQGYDAGLLGWKVGFEGQDAEKVRAPATRISETIDETIDETINETIDESIGERD